MDHQVSLLTEFARGRGWEVREDCIYEDEGHSATSRALYRLLKDAESGRFQVVLFKGISRLARDEEEAIGTANRLNPKGWGCSRLRKIMTSDITTRIPVRSHSAKV